MDGDVNTTTSEYASTAPAAFSYKIVNKTSTVNVQIEAEVKGFGHRVQLM